MGREGVTGALESQSIMLLKLFLNLPVARKRRTVPLILLFLLAEYAGHSIACLDSFVRSNCPSDAPAGQVVEQ